MSEALRDLVVSLSLQTDNFTRNIRSVNKQIQEAESRFRMAAAGVDDFEQTAAGLATKLTTLQQRLSLQQDVVNQYERALVAANARLQECYDRQNDYAARLGTARTAQEALRQQVALAAQTVRDYTKTLGENDPATVAAQDQLNQLKEAYRASVAEVRKLTGQNTALTKSTQNAADAVSQANTNLNNARAGVATTQAEINRCNQALALAQTNWDAAGDAIRMNSTAIATFGRQISVAESSFRLATQGIGNMEASVFGLQAQMTMLNEKVRLQQQQVIAYDQALAAARERVIAAQQAADPDKVQEASDAVLEAEAALNKAQLSLAETQDELYSCNRALTLAQTEWHNADDEIKASRKTITDIGKQISLAESKFRLATAGIKDMSKSVPGLSAKLDMLKKKLGLQSRQVTEYEKALEKAKEKLEAAEEAGDPERVEEATEAIQEAEAALVDAQAAVAETTAAIKDCNDELRVASSSWTEWGEGLEEVGNTLKDSGEAFETVGEVLSAGITAPVAALGAVAIKTSVSFESAFASVRKTVDATEDEFAVLSDEIKLMSTEIAHSADDIAEVVAIAGQLGIETEHLAEFARIMIDLDTSTDIVAEEAASTLAKFANITGMDQSQFSNLGSTLVELGNNYATTESSIMDMAMRLAAAGHQVGLSEAQILGFATALSSVGIEAEMGGSAFSKALVKMEVAAATGGQALEDFAAVSGMTAGQFKLLWDADPAAAFQAFIVGLAGMDEAGMSAIATLQEIGIAEVRLRDTLLRAVNATDLFAETQVMANAAWAANSALSEEAGKRYATTASQMTNLQNKALLFAQKIGDDLNPMIHDLIDGADEMLDKFLAMDDAQRMQIIQLAGFAAAIGPVLLLIGKVNKGLGSIVLGFSNFAKAVGKAGGGFKGFMKVLAKSPAFWLAITAAVITASVALSDYLTGAKKAREALKAMKDTAEEWQNTAAETFYGNSDGLRFFGMSEADFAREVGNMQSWLDGLIAVWTDGEKETDEIVSHWTESFQQMTDATRQELQELKDVADAGGYTDMSAQLAADIATLDAIDKEVEALLKKRQNGFFTEADQARLQQLIDMRGAIEIKYHLTPADTDGFATLQKKIDAEVARAHARGQQDASVTFYEDSIVAAAEGMAEINRQLDAQYAREYEIIMLMTDEAERQAALDELNTRYLNQRRAAALEYAGILSGIVMPVWNQGDIQKSADDVDQMVQLMRAYSAAEPEERPAILDQMNQLSQGMDESAMVEYIMLLTQIQSLLDSGMTEAEVQALFPEIDFTSALDQIAAIQAFLRDRPGELPGLEIIFGDAIPKEVLKIATDLDMTGAQARWDTFAANPGAITTDAVVQSYSEAATATKTQPKVDALITKYTETPEGADKSTLTPTGLVAYVTKYAEVTTGASITGLTPTNITAMVAAYQELATGTDITALKPDEITAYISQYLEANGVDTSGLSPGAITAFVLAYSEITGGASTAALKPSDITAIVVGYCEAEGIDVSKLSPDQIEAIVSSFAEATGCDKSELMQDFVAYIARYDDSRAIKPTLNVSIALSGYDLMAYRRFLQENPVEVEGIVRLGETYENPEDALLDPNTRFWHDGVEIPASAVTEEMLTADKVAVLDSDGTLHVLVTPEITGSEQARADLSGQLDEDYVSVQWGSGAVHKGDWGILNDILGGSTMDWVKNLTSRMDLLNREGKSWIFLWGLTAGLEKNGIDDMIDKQLSGDALANLTAYTSEAAQAINNGFGLNEADMTNLQEILEFVELAERLGIGTNVRAALAQSLTDAGIPTTTETLLENLQTLMDTAEGVGADAAAGVGEGMTGTDMRPYGEAVAANTDKALRGSGAFDSASPANSTKPVGRDAALGIGEGMIATDLSSYAAIVASGVRNALSAQLTGTSMRRIGINAMQGLRAGILAGRESVIDTMRAAVRAAVNAAKVELDINSPSGIFRDEVGVMAMRGIGEGFLAETEAQAKIIRNASRYLADEAQSSTIAAGSSDNSRTYNSNVNSTIQVERMVVRDEQDIRALAVEIASLTRRRQRGKGLRMA